VKPPGELMLHMDRVVRAPRFVVFTMYRDPDQLARWWGPKGFSTPGIELDLRVGGRYRIEMQPPEGDAFFLAGEFRVVEPPSRLVFTFCWEDPDPDDRLTVVELTLRERGASTELVIDQGPFATEARRALHEQGWSETIDRLDAIAMKG
jgi:uncharacterized protein YndB with AHSA1/START domain